MKKQVLVYVKVYVKAANDLKKGDHIVTGRMVVAEVESVEAFEDSTKRPCVIAVARSGKAKRTAIVSALNFLADETVLLVE